MFNHRCSVLFCVSRGRGNGRQSHGSHMKKSYDDDSSEGEREDEDNLTDSVGNDSGNEDFNDSAAPSRRPPVVMDPRGKQIRGPLGGRNRGRGGGGGRSQDSIRGRGGGRHHVVERKTSSDADSYSNEDDGNGDNGGDGDESGGSDDAF